MTAWYPSTRFTLVSQFMGMPSRVLRIGTNTFVLIFERLVSFLGSLSCDIISLEAYIFNSFRFSYMRGGVLNIRFALAGSGDVMDVMDDFSCVSRAYYFHRLIESFPFIVVSV